MKEKTAYVSVTYLFTVDPEQVGLEDDCFYDEFSAAVEDYMERVTCMVGEQAEIFPNDIEIHINGF